jgi:hypothetical protein
LAKQTRRTETANDPGFATDHGPELHFITPGLRESLKRDPKEETFLEFLDDLALG